MNDKTQNITTGAEEFKQSPLGFLMAVIAKYEAYMKKNYETNGDSESLSKSKSASELMDNLKIELSKTENLKKETSNEAVLMHVIENFEKDEQSFILECVFEYLNLLDSALQNIDSNSDEGNEIVSEYYNVSRLGLLLNCYLGEFSNDDFFYGILADMAETVKTDFSEGLISRIQKADIDLSFETFLSDYNNELDLHSQQIFYKDMIRSYSDSLLNKVLTEEVSEEEISKLACAKQIQRIYEKLKL